MSDNKTSSDITTLNYLTPYQFRISIFLLLYIHNDAIFSQLTNLLFNKEHCGFHILTYLLR